MIESTTVSVPEILEKIRKLIMANQEKINNLISAVEGLGEEDTEQGRMQISVGDVIILVLGGCIFLLLAGTLVCLYMKRRSKFRRTIENLKEDARNAEGGLSCLSCAVRHVCHGCAALHRDEDEDDGAYTKTQKKGKLLLKF